MPSLAKYVYDYIFSHDSLNHKSAMETRDVEREVKLKAPSIVLEWLGGSRPMFLWLRAASFKEAMIDTGNEKGVRNLV